MVDAIRLFVGAILRLLRTRRRLLLENLALRQQIAVLKRKHTRPRLAALDKLFWVLVRRFWSEWKQALILVGPETVVRWHRSGFAMYWRGISRSRRIVGRRRTSQEVRDLISRMVAENSTWGAPRIHGELLMLGFDISERTISRWMKRAPRDPEPAKRWLAFLRNRREAIAAMDLFTVPTITFGVLYCFFIIGHDRRRIVNFNVTSHPTAGWIIQQLREAFPRINRLLGSSSLIGTPNMVWRSRSRYARWPSGRFARRSKVPGKTELLSAGSRVADATC